MASYPCRLARLLSQAGVGLGFVIFAASSLASSALAEEAGDPVEEIVVYGEERPAMDVLTGSTITRIEVDDRLLEGARIDDLLADTPGVQIRRFGGAGDRFEISIRGSRPEQVPVFLDGFRLDTSLTGSSDLSTLCLDILQEIQVTRGAGAARSGSGAIGGVVNLVSRRPGEEPETKIRGSAGNFDSFEGSVRHARRIGDWDLSMGYCGFRTEGDFEYQQIGAETDGQITAATPILRRINNESERHTGLAQIGRSLGEGKIRVTQLVTNLDRGSPGLGLAGSQRAFADEKNFSTLSALAFEHPVKGLPHGRLDLGLAHRFERNHFKDPQVQIATSDPINTRTEVHGLVGSASLRAQHAALRGKHAWTLFAEGRFDRRDSNEASDKSRRSIALRAELESRWWKNRISVTPSIRLERYSGLDLEWLPSFAIQVEPVDGLVLRSSISRSYRAPSFQELYLPDKGFESGNPNLEPEEAWSYEIGGILQSPFDAPWLDFEIEGVYFAGEIDQGIAFQLVSSTRLSFVNTGRAETDGYELTLRWRPHEWVNMTGSRTVTRGELESSGCAISGIAASQTDARIELGPRDRFKVVGELHYTGRIALNSGCAASLPSRISYDASAGVDLTQLPIPYVDRVAKSLWLSVRGRNLGNIAQYDTRSFPQPGRNFSVALEGAF